MGRKKMFPNMESGLIVLVLAITCAVVAHSQNSALQLSVSTVPESQRTNVATAPPVFVGLSLTPYASDSVTPVPEGGRVENNVYRNSYFDLAYSLPNDWAESYKGPPPSQTGYYVLSQLKAVAGSSGKGTMSISAADMFFLRQPANNMMSMLRRIQSSLPDVMTVEKAPVEVSLNQRPFVRLDYSGVGIHWSLLATNVRCHALEFTLVSRDPEVRDKLVDSLNSIKLLPDSDEHFPACLSGYASSENIVHKVDPAMIGPRFTTVPVRIIVDKQGSVKHIHVINAFAEQAKSISDALSQWTFKPYIKNGQAVEIETGMLFEFKPDGVKMLTSSEESGAASAKNTN
jgi:hypothetical protein